MSSTTSTSLESIETMTGNPSTTNTIISETSEISSDTQVIPDTTTSTSAPISSKVQAADMAAFEQQEVAFSWQASSNKLTVASNGTVSVQEAVPTTFNIQAQANQAYVIQHVATNQYLQATSSQEETKVTAPGQLDTAQPFVFIAMKDGS